MSEHTKGVLIMVCSAVFFSIGGLFIKMIPWSPFAINGVRCMVGALVFGVYMLWQKKKITFNKPTLLGAVCVAGTAVLYNTAMKFTTTINGIAREIDCDPGANLYDVLRALGLPAAGSGFEAMDALHAATGVPVPPGLAVLRDMSVRHRDCVEKADMLDYVKGAVKK